MISYVSHPAREPGGSTKLGLAILVITGSALLARALTNSSIFAAVTVAVLALSIAAFLMPTRVVLDDSGIVASMLGARRARKWIDVRAHDVETHAIWLRTFRNRHWLDAFRAMRVPLPADPRLRAEVIALIAARRGDIS